MRNLLVFLILAGAALVAHALEAGSGVTAMSLFQAADIAEDISYPSGFTGVAWGDSSLDFEFGHADKNEFIGAGPHGDLFIAVSGRADQPPRYKGLIHWDGTGFSHLVQYVAADTKVWSVTVSPTTTGLLTAGHPVVAVELPGEPGTPSSWELWSIDPSTSPATETVVHQCSSAVNQVLIDGSGDIYVATYVDEPSTGAVLKLSFNGTDYDEELHSIGLHPHHVAIDGDGALYALEENPLWAQKRGSNDILRIDPDTGDQTVHAAVSRKYYRFFAMAADSTGRLWIGLTNGSDDVITEVTEGGTVDTRATVIASWIPYHTRTIVAGSGGELYVAEWTSVLADATTEVVALDPPAPGSGDDGGGKGGGKGKKK